MMNLTFEERRKVIGGSDVGAILGFCKYRTPLDVWLEKTGRSEEQPISEAMEWGNTLEPVIANKYANIKSCKLINSNKTFQYWNKKSIVNAAPLVAHIDRLVENDGILECKTSRYPDCWGDIDREEVPTSYLLQVQYYMGMLNRSWCDIAVLIGGNEFRIYHLKKNDSLFKQILTKIYNFYWDYIYADIAPPTSTYKDVKKLWPTITGKSRIATGDECKTIIDMKINNNEMSAIKEDLKPLEKKNDEFKKELSIAMADNDALLDASGDPLVAWKKGKRGIKVY